MKKLAILILVVVSLFSMTACGSNKDINKGISIEPNDASRAGSYANRDKDARDEAIYRHEYVLRLSEEPEALAEFLLTTDELDAFVEVDTEDHSRPTINNHKTKTVAKITAAVFSIIYAIFLVYSPCELLKPN